MGSHVGRPVFQKSPWRADARDPRRRPRGGPALWPGDDRGRPGTAFLSLYARTLTDGASLPYRPHRCRGAALRPAGQGRRGRPARQLRRRPQRGVRRRPDCWIFSFRTSTAAASARKPPAPASPMRCRLRPLRQRNPRPFLPHLCRGGGNGPDHPQGLDHGPARALDLLLALAERLLLRDRPRPGTCSFLSSHVVPHARTASAPDGAGEREHACSIASGSSMPDEPALPEGSKSVPRPRPPPGRCAAGSGRFEVLISLPSFSLARTGRGDDRRLARHRPGRQIGLAGAAAQSSSPVEMIHPGRDSGGYEIAGGRARPT